MEIRELKTLLKFQNVQLEEWPPSLKLISRRNGASKSLHRPNTADKKRVTGDVANLKETSEADFKSWSEWKGPDHGGGDSPCEVTRYSSSESLNSSSTEVTSTGLLTSDVLESNKYSVKPSLKSFAEVRPYQRTTYVSCLKKLDDKTQTLRQVLQNVPKMNKPAVNAPLEEKGGSKKLENENYERKESKDYENKESKIYESTENKKDEQTSNKSSSVALKPYTPSEDNEELYCLSDDESEYSFEEESEESEGGSEDFTDKDYKRKAYEKAKEIVRKITGHEPVSEDENETGDDNEEKEKDDDEITVFHFRPNPKPRKVPPGRRCKSATSHQPVVIEKSRTAKEAVALAARAAKLLRRAAPLFRDISPMARLLENKPS